MRARSYIKKILLILGVALVFKIGIAVSLHGFHINEIPDGYSEGRKEAPYGAYNTPYEGQAKKYSDFLDLLEPKVYGLSQYSAKDEVAQSEAVFYMEHLVLGSFLQIENDPHLDEFEKESLSFRCVRLYQSTRKDAERLYESMIRKVDIALPGPNGSQIRNEGTDAGGDVVYYPNCRMEKCPTPEEQKSFYDKKMTEFLQSGKTLTEMYVLTPESLAKMKEVTRVEYVERGDESVWITEGNAGHLLLAEGKGVRTAGQEIFVKNKNGDLILIIASNASGTYKPDIFSAQRGAMRLAARFNLPPERVVVTEGEPLGVQTVKVFMKAAFVDAAVIDKKVNEMKERAKNLLWKSEIASGEMPPEMKLLTGKLETPKKKEGETPKKVLKNCQAQVVGLVLGKKDN